MLLSNVKIHVIKNLSLTNSSAIGIYLALMLLWETAEMIYSLPNELATR